MADEGRADLEAILDRLHEGLAGLERLDEPARGEILGFLDDLEQLHRTGLQRLAELLGADDVPRLRDSDSVVAWLFDAYGVGVDERAEAEAALQEEVLPYIHSHGGTLEVLDVTDGVVRVRMAGSCSGCTGSTVTLRNGVEQALQQGMPGFAALEVEEDEEPAAPHPPPASPQPPPGATTLPIQAV
jgi:Fe-S cluster biogenesis protein NfuA